MKKVAIFDDCYETSEKLEKAINKQMMLSDAEIIGIDVKNYVYSKEKVGIKTEYNLFWYATVIYEE